MSPRHLVRSVSALALVLGLAPRSLVAQVQPLQGYMNNYSGPILNSGFQVVTPMVTNGINGGTTSNHPVTMNAGRQYVILGVCDNDCSDLDLRLFGPDGSQIIQDIAVDDHPTLRLMAPVTGSYRLDVIMATCRQNPCYYGIQLFGGAQGPVAMNQPMGTPQPMAMNVSGPTAMGQISANQQVSGNLTSMDGRWDSKPAQTWAFTCQAGQSFQMDILSTWDNYAIVFDPMNNTVARDDDGGEGVNARINHTCTMSGVYRLGVTTYTSSTTPGAYTLQVQAMAAMSTQPQPMAMNMAAPTAMGQIAANQQVAGNLTAMDGRWDNKPAQTWAFTCQAGQSFQMDVLSTWDNYAVVFDPMNTPVARDDDTGEGLNARINHTCTMAGVYRLGVTTYTASTTPGAYTLQVQSMAPVTMQPQPMATPQPMNMPVQQAAPGATMPSPSPTPGIVGGLTGGIPAPGQIGRISAGTNVQGRLETGDQRMNDGTWADVWQFNGAQGQHVIVEIRSEEFDTYVQLMDAQGNKLAEDDDSLGEMNSKVEITLPANGVYQIIVNNFSDERRAGIYTVTLR